MDERIRTMRGIRIIYNYMRQLYQVDQDLDLLVQERERNNLNRLERRDYYARTQDLREHGRNLTNIIDNRAERYGVDFDTLGLIETYVHEPPDRFPGQARRLDDDLQDNFRPFTGPALRLIDDPSPPVANERIPVAEQAELIRFLNQIPPEYNPTLTRGVGSMYPINEIIRI